MNGAMAPDNLEHAIDMCLAFEISKLAQDDVATKMGIAIGVAPGASERTFTRDFDR
jgi:hypothetical protein